MKNLVILFLILISSAAQTTTAAAAATLVAPLKKDALTSLYTITLNSGDRYAVDLSAPFSWRVCPTRRRPTAVPCFSTECIQATYLLSPTCSLPISPPPPPETTPCTACIVTPINPRTKSCASAQLTTETLIISSTNPTAKITLNNTFLSCAPKPLLHSLPKGVVGLASLSLAPLSLPSQLSANLALSRSFAICLPSTNSANGVVFFGDGPYKLLPPTNFDAADLLSYTPMLRNPKTADYFIGIKSLSINENSVITMSPFEGIKISTFVPYTTLRRDVYKLFRKSFLNSMKNIPRTKSVKPFNTCFNATAIGFSRVGLHVPQIDLEFANGKNWTIYGANSMKQVGGDSACLAFLDGGKMAEYSIVIGSFQMEDNLVLFDIDRSRLGFSSSLYFERMTCNGFNFTSKV
ncbi:hypothetical protein ABFS83_07G026900 [Erythranthe nasuta]